MPNNWNIAITHYDISTAIQTIITDNFISLPMATDTGTEDINSARLVLSAPSGKFLTTTPVLDQFDRIRIVITDDSGSIYNKVFDIIKIIPSWTKSEGTRVTLQLVGIEHWLQKINYIKPFAFEGAFEVVQDIGRYYNVNRGTLQPELTGHDSTTHNKLPTSNYQKNSYDFAVNEAPCMDRIMETVDKLGGSVDNGGILDFYDFKFNSDPVSFTTMQLKVFSSGSPTAGSEPVLSESSSTNVGETDSGIESITGTVVSAWGAVDQGSLPVNISQYNSKNRRLNFLPYWATTENYKENSIVLYDGGMYKANQDNIAEQPDTSISWDSWTETNYYGNLVYSPWTHGVDSQVGNKYWRDSGTNPTNTIGGNKLGNGFYDNNVIVYDDVQNYYRTMVDVVLTTSNPKPSDITSNVALQKYLYNNTNFYRGFRVLLIKACDTTAAKLWSSATPTKTTDKNNKAFSQSILQYDGTEWVVKYTPNTTGLVCVVRDTGTLFKYTAGTPNSWIEQSYLDNESCHQYNSIFNSTGIPVENYTSYNADSAITVRYDFSVPVLFNLTDNLLKAGAWLNISFPFPTAKINHSTPVGKLYGGAVSDRHAVCEPATLDMQNMHLTHDGFRGFNNSASSEDFGQISSIDFWIKMNFQVNLGVGYEPTTGADYKMRCSMIDTSDNVVIQDFLIQFHNHWEQIKLPISGFNIYRGRKPTGSIFNLTTPPKDLQIINSFQFKNIKSIIIQTQESYDEHGRYSPLFTINRYLQQVKVNYNDKIAEFRRVELSIDAFRFTKPLLANTGSNISRCFENDFIERPEIMDYYQLKNDAAAELEKRRHRHVEYDIVTTGKCNINFGDYFLYENSLLIPSDFETPPNSGSNQIKLVAKHIEYSITKPVNGKGGFLRRIMGVKRF